MTAEKSPKSFMHKMRSARKHEEEDQQRALLTVCDMHLWKWPELRLLYHVPNGGKRSKIEAAILTGLGVRPGVPDLALPVARRPYHGLYIELKRLDVAAKLSTTQAYWIIELQRQGYMAVCCHGAIEAWETIKNYLSQPSW